MKNKKNDNVQPLKVWITDEIYNQFLFIESNDIIFKKLVSNQDIKNILKLVKEQKNVFDINLTQQQFYIIKNYLERFLSDNPKDRNKMDVYSNWIKILYDWIKFNT